MKQNQPISREQWREGILEMLKSAKSDEQGKFLKSSDTRKQEVLHALAKERGADRLIQEIDECRSKSNRCSEELVGLGFEYDSVGDLSLKWDAPRKLRSAYSEELSKPQVDQKSLKKFDVAILQVLTVETPSEAREIAESVLA